MCVWVFAFPLAISCYIQCMLVQVDLVPPSSSLSFLWATKLIMMINSTFYLNNTSHASKFIYEITSLIAANNFSYASYNYVNHFVII